MIVGVRSGDEASEESVPIPSTALKRLPLQHGTGGRYRLDLRQAPFRLFNNYLVPISNTEEATDALRAVAESITVLLQSIEASVPLEMQVTSISVRQRWFASFPPAKFTRPLPPAVYNVLQQHRDCLHPFLLSLQPPPRPRRSRHAPMANRNYLSRPAQRVWGTKSSPKSTLLSNVSQIELEMACVKAASGEMNEKLLAPDYTEAMEEGSRGTDETSEQEVEPSLGSDVDDMPTRIMKPSNCSSISDLIYELEDAASVAAEGEAEEGERMEEDEKAYRLRISRSRSRSVPAHLEDTTCGQMLKLTNPTIVASVSRSSSSPLLGCLFHHSLSPQSQIYERRSSSSRTYMKLSHPTLTGEDRLVLPRSSSCNDCNSRMIHRLPYRRIAVSDPEITCYRALYGLTVEQRPPPKSLHVSQSKGDLGLQEELNMRFQIFTFASIGRLQESANPRFVSRLRQRQEANASAVNQARNLICSSEDVIKTQFIIF
ncbi:unnamed protein product [Hydatigera taeniaeformis]|uniref:Uncharacterized protein n=1 Tax=Hydatigena taeniaeformis TaxID=6205 RepID=A0A0R3X9E7_HYDTA|nr:unnamed protein product [Hydatigera taeniaeformis]